MNWILMGLLLYPVGYLVLRYGLLFEKSDIEKMDDGIALAGIIGWLFIGIVAYGVWKIAFCLTVDLDPYLSEGYATSVSSNRQFAVVAAQLTVVAL